jgi:NTE family protein
MGDVLMPTAFVLSGGASLGAVQLGMLRALLERGITPDLVVGSSVGALNGGWLAGSPHLEGVEKLEAIWRSIGRSAIFPVRPLSGLLGFLGRRAHLVPPEPLERLLRHHLPYTRLEDARVPLHIVATDVADGVEVLLSSGDAVRAILASAAIPGVFPPVSIGDHQLMDGGVVDNNPISHAVHLGATVVYVLPTGYSCALPEAPRSALGMALHALNLMTVQRLLIDIERYEKEVELHVIPPPCPLSVSPADFSRTVELIAASHTAAEGWLDGPQRLVGQRRLLAFHHHPRPVGTVRQARRRRASA